MSRRMRIVQRRREVELSQGDSKITSSRDPDRSPLAKVLLSRDPRKALQAALAGAVAGKVEEKLGLAPVPKPKPKSKRKPKKRRKKAA